MAFITFDERFHVGHQDIDSQHAGLFDAVNRLHDAMMAGKARQEVGGILAFLRGYTVDHFRSEEALMRAGAYPGYEAHKRLHDDLTRQVLDLEEKQRTGSVTLSLSVMNFLKDWLAHHISVEDRKVAARLASRT